MVPPDYGETHRTTAEVSGVASREGAPPIDRRWLLLLLAILLVILGIGIGGLPEGDDPDSTQPLDVTVTTPTPTPTPPGGGGGGTVDTERVTQEDEATPTPTAEAPTPTQDDFTDEGTVEETDGDDDENDVGGGTGGGGSGETGGDGSTDGDEDRPTLVPVGDSSARIQYANLAPGDDGQNRLHLENVGNASGDLSLKTVDLQANVENGVTEPEAAVDDSPRKGELAENLLLTLRVNRTGGQDSYLYGTGSGSRSLASLAKEDRTGHVDVLDPGEQAEIVVDWHVPGSTGNEIQSDGVVFDLTFTLKAQGS